MQTPGGCGVMVAVVHKPFQLPSREAMRDPAEPRRFSRSIWHASTMALLAKCDSGSFRRAA